ARAAEVDEQRTDAMRLILRRQPDDGEVERLPARMPVVARNLEGRALVTTAAVGPCQPCSASLRSARGRRGGECSNGHDCEEPSQGAASKTHAEPPFPGNGSDLHGWRGERGCPRLSGPSRNACLLACTSVALIFPPTVDRNVTRSAAVLTRGSNPCQRRRC